MLDLKKAIMIVRASIFIKVLSVSCRFLKSKEMRRFLPKNLSETGFKGN